MVTTDDIVHLGSLPFELQRQIQDHTGLSSYLQGGMYIEHPLA